MPNIIVAIAPRRAKRPKEEESCLVCARAEFVSLGGIIVFALCILFTALLLFMLTVPGATSAQLVIALVLVAASWVYFINSVTEKLSLVDHSLVFTSVLGRARRIPLSELEAMVLRHEGFNLERGMQTIELRQAGKKPDRISLGPCWQRNKLDSFLDSVDRALQQL